MLCPLIVRIATVAVLREESACRRIIVPGVHVEQAGGVRNAARERHLVEERIARAGRHAELVVVVRLHHRTFLIHDVRDAPAHVVPVEEVVVRIRVLPGGRLPLEPLARHDRARWVEDVLRLQHVLVHRREQQRGARVVEVRNDLVLHPRHALPLRIVRIRRARRQRDHRVIRDAGRGQPVGQIVAIVRGRRHARPRLHLLRLVATSCRAFALSFYPKMGDSARVLVYYQPADKCPLRLINLQKILICRLAKQYCNSTGAAVELHR